MGHKIKTDKRLLALLDGARMFSSAIDPDEMTAEGVLQRVVIDRKGQRWTYRYAFDNGTVLVIEGRFQESEMLITGIRTPDAEGNKGEIPCLPSKRLIESLGPLNGLPARLKKVLSKEAKTAASTGKLNHTGYVALLKSALMWEVEAKNENEPMAGFEIFRIVFHYNREDVVCGVDFSAACDMEEGRITVSANADLYGLGNKKVVLEKNLGMGRSISAICQRKKDDKTLPSLKAAFDLYDAIPLMYESQRKKDNTMGRPKAKR